MNQKAAARIAQQRLRNQHIAAQAFDKPGDLVRWFGAVQAQDYYEALWAIGLRTKHAVVATVERGIAERDVVRT
ncbi:MAG: winged helix DNA-binding domain-containing protein, partial [Gemmatimonadota bacterium]